MGKLVIMGSGAAPGVPSIACGWGDCNPDNPKNRRRRTTTYVEFGQTQLLIDTSPDLHDQLWDSRVCRLDGVLYTHCHADHLHGIDDLRDLNRLSRCSIDVYANGQTCSFIRQRFSYLVSERDHPNNPIFRPSLIVNEIDPGEDFRINDVKITPLNLEGHAVETTGYSFNDGEIVYIADCKEIPEKTLALIKQRPKLLVMPLTTLHEQTFHMGLDKLLEYVRIINPHKTIINHMAVECDYDHVNLLTPDHVVPAFDNMTIEF